jgi:hypothetical protein
LIFYLLAALLGTVFLYYHLAVYPIARGDSYPWTWPIFESFWITMGILSSLATLGVTLCYFLAYEKKGFSFVAGLAFLHFFLISLLSSTYEAIYFYPEAQGLGTTIILEAIFLGFVPFVGLILGLVFYANKRWALPIVFSIAFVFLFIAEGFFLARGAIQDYGEPYSGQGGPLHFVFLLPALLFALIAGVFAIVDSYKENFRQGLHK